MQKLATSVELQLCNWEIAIEVRIRYSFWKTQVLYMMINNVDGGDFTKVHSLYSWEENYWFLDSDYAYWLHWIPITSNSKGCSDCGIQFHAGNVCVMKGMLSLEI